jgi:lysophospholipase L1-like esterase
MFLAKGGMLLFLRPFNPNRQVFQSHPHLVIQGIPSVSATVMGTTISHNALGFRGPEISLEAKRRKRIVAVGGSTTYGVSVSDSDTWPALLQKELGEAVEVINAGIPAASTVEHIHLLATIVPELKPDVLLLHVGLNDLRNMHVRELALDYANFHPPSMIGNIGLCPEEPLPRVATIRALVMVLQRVGLYPDCSFNTRAKGTPNTTIDLYAARLFERNVKTLLLLARAQGASVILIPQILIDEMIKDGSYRWWTPYIDQRFLVAAVDHYNRILADQASATGPLYASAVLEVDWQKKHFADPSHLNELGNKEFALRLAQLLQDKLARDS